jgi:hypothetical protein
VLDAVSLEQTLIGFTVRTRRHSKVHQLPEGGQDAECAVAEQAAVSQQDAGVNLLQSADYVPIGRTASGERAPDAPASGQPAA